MRFKISPPKFHQLNISWVSNFSQNFKSFGAPILNFQPKLTKTWNAASGLSFWNFFEKIFLVRFWTNLSYPLAGIWNISKKMAFWNFWILLFVQAPAVLELVHKKSFVQTGVVVTVFYCAKSIKSIRNWTAFDSCLLSLSSTFKIFYKLCLDLRFTGLYMYYCAVL